MNVRARLACLGMVAAVALSGCGGPSGGNLSAPAPPGAGGSAAGAASLTRTYSLTGAAGSYAFAPVGGFSGSLRLPASADVPAQTSLQLTSSLDAPPRAPLLQSAERRMQATGTLGVYMYATVLFTKTVTYPAPPGFSIALPATVDPTGLSFFYAISNPTPNNGAKVQYRTEGPATVSGQVVTFAPSATPLTFLAGTSYVIALYATGNARVGARKIYVTNANKSTVTTYNADGSPSTAFVVKLNFPIGVAVDASGKIFISDYGDGGPNGSVTAYEPDGTPTTPTIAGLSRAEGVAVDAAGTIYVANADFEGTVKTYYADGTRSALTIPVGHQPVSVAVDAFGKIYVANVNADTVATYNADASRSTPTITAGLSNPFGVAVDAAGKIYVANSSNGTVTTYNADGTRATPTITTGLSAPIGVAVDAAGKIYVANVGAGCNVTTFDADGTQTTPTIEVGVSVGRFGLACNLSGGIAVR